MFNILIVDDEPSVLAMLKSILKSNEYKILEAANGTEARAVYQASPVDLMITDIVMPEKHGIDLIIETRKEFPAMPIIAITGGGGIVGRFDYLEIAKLLGARNILRKPFTAYELRDSVKKAVPGTDFANSIKKSA